MMSLLVHVDDIIFSGPSREIDVVVDALSKLFTLTQGKKLEDVGDACVMLGRTITRTSTGFSVTSDPSLLEKSVKDLNLESAKPAPTPLSADVLKDIESPLLDKDQHRRYRTHVGRLLYLSHDRADLSFAAKHLSRSLHAPTEQSWKELKRTFRYLLGHKELPYHVDNEVIPKTIDVYTDSDWASCHKTRKSTSGGTVLLSGTPITCWSRTQPTISLSSAEAELSACVTAVAEGLYIQKILAHLGVSSKLVLFCDSSAAINHLKRLGVGRMKHLQIKSAYLQMLVKDRTVSLRKILGTENIADIFTKPLGSRTLKNLLDSKLWSLDTSSHVACREHEVVDVERVLSFDDDTVQYVM
jgi:hypothetical protein